MLLFEFFPCLSLSHQNGGYRESALYAQLLGTTAVFNKCIVAILISIKIQGIIKLIVLKLIKKIKAQSQIHHTSSRRNSSCIETK